MLRGSRLPPPMKDEYSSLHAQLQRTLSIGDGIYLWMRYESKSSVCTHSQRAQSLNFGKYTRHTLRGPYLSVIVAPPSLRDNILRFGCLFLEALLAYSEVPVPRIWGPHTLRSLSLDLGGTAYSAGTLYICFERSHTHGLLSGQPIPRLRVLAPICLLCEGATKLCPRGPTPIWVVLMGQDPTPCLRGPCVHMRNSKGALALYTLKTKLLLSTIPVVLFGPTQKICWEFVVLTMRICCFNNS